MTTLLERTWELSRAEVKGALDGAVRDWGIPDQKLPSDDFELDCYKAAIEVLFSEIEDLFTYDIIAHPSYGDLELEYQLEMLDKKDEIIGVAEIVIGSEAKLPVSIRVTFNA